MNRMRKCVASLAEDDCIFYCGSPAHVLSAPEVDGKWCKLTLATQNYVVTGWQPAWLIVDTFTAQ